MNDVEREAILRTVPQRLVGRMLGGKQTIHLQRMASRWGFPVDGRSVDMFAVMGRLKSFLKQHGPALAALMEDDGGDENSLGVQYLRARIRKVQADADAAEMRVQQKGGQLVDRNAVHEVFAALTSRFQDASRRAQSRWGQDGFDFFSELTERICADISTISSKLGTTDDNDPQPADDSTPDEP